MFASRKPIPFTIPLPDTSATITIPALEVAAGGGSNRVAAARVFSTKAVASHADNHVSVELLDGGAAGAGTDVIGTAVGGASTAWVIGTPKEITIATNKLDEGDRLMFKYTKAGTVDPGTLFLQVDLVQGA